MTVLIDPTWHMWMVIALVAMAMVSFAVERVSLETTSIVVLSFLLVWFELLPLPDAQGVNQLDAVAILRGFANPSLLAVLALMVMGQAMLQTGALNGLTRMFVRLSKHHQRLSLSSGFAGVLVISAFLNNTPVVVMFIPIMQALAVRMNRSPSTLMMPLSFAAILGGMTTLIGSSTNMLVSSALTELGETPLRMFDFSVIGICMAGVGAVYVIVILPRLLPHRGSMAGSLLSQGKQFIAEIEVTADSPLVGQQPAAGQFKGLPDITVRVIQRNGVNLLPPFDGLTLEEGDTLITAATRQALTDVLARSPGSMLHDVLREPSAADEARRPTERLLAEVMIAPASRMIEQTVEVVGFQRRFNCRVLGIQRRGRMARQRVGGIRLEAGDVLLVAGSQDDVEALGRNPDLVVIAGATRDIPRLHKAGQAAAIFSVVVLLASSMILPISVAAILGAVAMVVTGCLNIRQAGRAVDRRILLLVAASLALGTALERTGGATFLATALLDAIGSTDPMINVSILFLVVAAATNVLTNNACAILFTPIAVGVARTLGLEPSIMAITVLLAANCSFASPIGYQTNLLVMGPGHYRFMDFLRGGLPLLVLMWLTFTLLAPHVFGL
ncbi:MAG: SLC13 family permease [Inquilinaceae bacterium]